MRKATETTLRYLTILQLIPVYPKMASVKEIRKQLIAKTPDYGVSVRSIQRDLDKISLLPFPISSEQQGRTNHWFWTDKHAITQIPAMNPSTALALKLALAYLKPLMPPATLRLLTPYFQKATEILQQTKLGRWSARTRIITRGPELIPPTVSRNVQQVVYEALLENRQFKVSYQSREQTAAERMILSPLGIVFRSGITYLVATAWDYQDPRHYALHRMRRATLSDKPANVVPGFELARHIEEEEKFSYPVSGGKIKLRALFSEGAAVHLSESKLSGDQKITRKKDGGMLVEATVTNTAELRWWLLGFGSGVEILGPKGLRENFVRLTDKMYGMYRPNRPTSS